MTLVTMEPLQSFRGRNRSAYDLSDARARQAVAADARRQAAEVASIMQWLGAQCKGCPPLRA